MVDLTPNSRPDWIAIYITHNLPEAHIIVGKLRALRNSRHDP